MTDDGTGEPRGTRLRRDPPRVVRAVSAPITGGSAAPGGRSDRDIICAGMYRACSTWQYEVVAHLIGLHRGGTRLGYLTGEQYGELVRAGGLDGIGAAGPRWRVLKSHEGDRSFRRMLADGRALAVYAHRDVRDVVYSLMHKRGVTFEQLLRQGMIHQVLANDRFWMSQPGVLVQRYDDLLAEPVVGVAELADHLGIAITGDDAARIAAEYSLESNKARTEALRRRLEEAGLDLDDAANLQICDSTTLLHWNHVRQGTSGSWSTQATPRQRTILDRLCRPWLEARGYPVESRVPPGGSEHRRGTSLRERLVIESDLMAARLSYLTRNASLTYPGAARLAKRLLGIRTDATIGATTWADRPRSDVQSETSSAAVGEAVPTRFAGSPDRS